MSWFNPFSQDVFPLPSGDYPLVPSLWDHILLVRHPFLREIWVIQQLLALAGMSGAMIGFLGLLWGQAFGGRLGPLGVVLCVLGYGMIVIGGLALLVISPAESPLFLLFPIGGNLSTLGYILMGIATIRGSRWYGWQRWMPLVAAIVAILTMGLPMLLGVTPDGQGMIPKLLQGVLWIGVGLAVFTASPQPVSMPALAVR